MTPRVTRPMKDPEGRRATRHFDLIVSLPVTIELQIRVRQAPVQPMAQPSVKLIRGFAFASSAIAEELFPALKLSDSDRRSFETAHERQ